MATSTQRSRHYTGMDIFEWAWSVRGVELIGYDVFAGGSTTHRRLTVLNAVMLHLFTGYTNWTNSRGWEFGTTTLRRGHWLRWLLDWSIGWGDPSAGFRVDPHGLRRLGRLAFGRHNARLPRQVWDELTCDLPRYYATPEQARQAIREREMDEYYQGSGYYE